MYDLAGISKKTIAPDIEEYIQSNPSLISLLRAAKESKITNEELQQLEKRLVNQKQKH